MDMFMYYQLGGYDKDMILIVSVPKEIVDWLELQGKEEGLTANAMATQILTKVMDVDKETIELTEGGEDISIQKETADSVSDSQGTRPPPPSEHSLALDDFWEQYKNLEDRGEQIDMQLLWLTRKDHVGIFERDYSTTVTPKELQDYLRKKQGEENGK